MDAQTTSPALLVLLGNLPKTWQDPDDQLYHRCDKCCAESRASIMNVSSAVREPVDQPCGRCIDCGCADHQVLTAGERGLQHLWLDADGDILGRGAAIDLKVYTAV